jgi:hypothetical protein
MTNWIHPAKTVLLVTRRLISFRDEHDLERFDQVISFWEQADQSRDKPVDLLRLFGEGLALFLTLPDYIKNIEIKPGLSAYNVYIRNALCEAVSIANDNRIRVTFDTGGPVFH